MADPVFEPMLSYIDSDYLNTRDSWIVDIGFQLAFSILKLQIEILYCW